jgi:hypothetical protein
MGAKARAALRPALVSHHSTNSTARSFARVRSALERPRLIQTDGEEFSLRVSGGSR